MGAVFMFRTGVLTAVLCTLAARSFGQAPEDYDDPPPAPQFVTQAQAIEFPTNAGQIPNGSQQPAVINNAVDPLPTSVRGSTQTEIWNGSNGFGNPGGSPFDQSGSGYVDDSYFLDPAHKIFGTIGRTPSHFARHGWVRMEYLGWFVNGMHTPPLVTTGTNGVIGDPNTTVLFGGSSLLTGLRSGGRCAFGTWLNCCETVGLEAEYFSLPQAVQTFSASSDPAGNPPLFRPFFNINPTSGGPPTNSSEIVSDPGASAGTVSVRATSRLDGAGLRIMFRGCCSQWCEPGDCEMPVLNRSVQTNFFAGYRYLRLAEGLQINESLTSLMAANPGTFNNIFDQFNTENTFSGLDLGGTFLFQQNRWSMEVMSRLAAGWHTSMRRWRPSPPPSIPAVR